MRTLLGGTQIIAGPGGKGIEIAQIIPKMPLHQYKVNV